MIQTVDHYIDRTVMNSELAISQQQGSWTAALTDQMRRLARGVAHHDFFIRYSDREGLIQSGLLHLLEIWNHFDTTRPNANPFGYFSKCLFREYARVTNIEYKYSNFKSYAREIADHYSEHYIMRGDDD